MNRVALRIWQTATAATCCLPVQPSAADKPRTYWLSGGDDIGTWNISHNSRGMMGYKTPNIDRHRQRRRRLYRDY